MDKKLLKWYFCINKMPDGWIHKYFDAWVNLGIVGMLGSLPPTIVFDNPKSYDIFFYYGGIINLKSI